MKFTTNFVAMLSLVGRIKFSLNCHPALELRDITHVQCTYTHLFTGRISKLGLHPLQSYGCIRITSWITLVVCMSSLYASFKRIGSIPTENQRTNSPVNAHLISGPTGSTKTNKIGQSQPSVIIYINFEELEFPMLHAKFQDHSTSGSGEEDF